MLAFGGLAIQRIPLPELDLINFAPRVRVPVLMINSRNDPYYRLETSQRPMYRLLGTPPQHKRHRVHNAPGHGVPQHVLESETLSWLGQYLGEAR